MGERENEKKEREVEFYRGLEPLYSAYIQMDRQTDQGPPPPILVLLLVLSSTIESKVLMREIDGVIRVNEINMHSVINTH